MTSDNRISHILRQRDSNYHRRRSATHHAFVEEADALKEWQGERFLFVTLRKTCAEVLTTLTQGMAELSPPPQFFTKDFDVRGIPLTAIGIENAELQDRKELIERIEQLKPNHTIFFEGAPDWKGLMRQSHTVGRQNQFIQLQGCADVFHAMKAVDEYVKALAAKEGWKDKLLPHDYQEPEITLDSQNNIIVLHLPDTAASVAICNQLMRAGLRKAEDFKYYVSPGDQSITIDHKAATKNSHGLITHLENCTKKLLSHCRSS